MKKTYFTRASSSLTTASKALRILNLNRYELVFINLESLSIIIGVSFDANTFLYIFYFFYNIDYVNQNIKYVRTLRHSGTKIKVSKHEHLDYTGKCQKSEG